MRNIMTTEKIRRRKTGLFICAVILSLFSSMSKVLVPNAVFDQLQNELGLNVSLLASLSSWYMYAYATSQLFLGLFVESLGGVRVLFFAGITFSLGSLLFPLCSTPWLMFLVRIITGLGAGSVFIGLLKLLTDLYNERFGYIMGFSMFLGYLGTTLGSGPMVGLVHLCGWRMALLIPAFISLTLFLLMLLFMPGTAGPRTRHPEILRPLKEAMLQGNMIRLTLIDAFWCGVYYTMLNVMGRKCLEDALHFPVRWSALLLTLLTVIVAVLNFSTGFICRIFKGHYRQMILGIGLVGLAGYLLGYLTISRDGSGWLMALAYVLIGIPAGCFSINANLTKEDSPPQYISLRVTLLNVWAFVMIAVLGKCGGMIMHWQESRAVLADGVLHYPPEAYQGVFLMFILTGLISLYAAWGLFPQKRDDRLKI